jgi:hypothetical protein
MALLHQATVTPSKLELVRAWLPSQPWYLGENGAELTLVAAYRFDDPDGEVGVETLLTAAPDGAVFQVPVTYRGAPLEGAERWLIGTMDHSVLGPRWVYDGLGDPVYLATVEVAIRTGGQQAEVLIEIDGEMVTREPTAVVKGSGSGTAAAVEGAVVEVVRYPDRAQALGDDVLTGTWAGQADGVVLVRVAR